jgi:hypothetical protein
MPKRRAAASVFSKKPFTWVSARRAPLEIHRPPVTVRRLAPLAPSSSRQISWERIASGT